MTSRPDRPEECEPADEEECDAPAAAPDDWPPPQVAGSGGVRRSGTGRRCARRRTGHRRAIGSDTPRGATGITAVPLAAVGELTVVELEKLGLPATVAVSDLDNVAGPVDGVFEFTKRWEEGS